MFRNFFPLLLSLFLLISCNQAEEAETPAQDQIKNYNKELEDCKDNAEKKAKEEKEKKKEKEDTGKVAEQKVKHVRGYDIEPDDMVLGNRNSKIVVVEYFSPTCPHCVTYHKRILPELKAKYIDTGKVAYVMREFIGNKQDLDATVLARCAGNLESYLNFIKVILEQQDNWAFGKNYREILTNIGTLGGVGPEKYANCLNDEAKIEILIENTRLISREPKFVGTPSFFINGKQFTKPYTFEELSQAIENVVIANE
ncbi:MAG: DsbA family protein [Rickettsiaceae bacterium]|nr:DsbA family protein [Rickettsiaceae bacterium]